MKKTVLLLLVVGLLAVSTVACAGSNLAAGAGAPAAPEVPDVNNENDELNPNDGSDIEFDLGDIELGQAPYVDTSIPYYLPVTGIVTFMEEVNGLVRIEIEDADGNPAVLVLGEDTVFPFLADFTIGDTVTGWYPANSPMIMIWPAEYSVKVLAAAPGGMNIQVNRFHAWEDNTEGYWLSQNEDFAFRTDENTEIVLEDGTDFSDGDLEGRRIVVIYGASTRSIPEMATAEKLIVLFEDIMPLI